MRFCRPILSLKKVILACILQGIVAEVICCTVLFFLKELVDLMQKKRIQPNIFIFKYLNFIECQDGNTMRQFLDELQVYYMYI